MVSGAVPTSGDGSTVLDRWSARKIQPIVVLYVLAVFAAFIALSIVVFDSWKAVKALLIAAVGAAAATLPGVIEKVEYRLTGSGIDKRPINTKKPREFTGVFRWDELSHVVPMKRGFKYYKTMGEAGPFRRFWNTQISDEFSGEVHVEERDLERILEIVARQGIVVLHRRQTRPPGNRGRA